MPTVNMNPNPNAVRYDLPFTSYDLTTAFSSVRVDSNGYALRSGRHQKVALMSDEGLGTLSMATDTGVALFRCTGTGANKRSRTSDTHTLWPGESPGTTSYVSRRPRSMSTSTAVPPPPSTTAPLAPIGTRDRRSSSISTAHLRRFSFKSILPVPRPSLVAPPQFPERVSENALSTHSSGSSTPSLSPSGSPSRSRSPSLSRVRGRGMMRSDESLHLHAALAEDPTMYVSRSARARTSQVDDGDGSAAGRRRRELRGRNGERKLRMQRSNSIWSVNGSRGGASLWKDAWRSIRRMSIGNT